MFNSSLGILYSPILIAQGLYTKWKTPRLEEAQGNRQGQVGQHNQQYLRLLIVGDSAAAGVGAELQSEALSGQIVQGLSHRFDCQWALHAKSGFTSQDISDYLAYVPALDFDIAVVSIGMNDVLQPFLSTQKWLQQMSQLHQILKDKFQVEYVIYTAIPPIHQFPALPQPLRYCLGQTAQQFNQAFQQQVKHQSDCMVLSIEMPFQAEFVAQDGFHPSPLAYGIWAKQVVEVISKWMINR